MKNIILAIACLFIMAETSLAIEISVTGTEVTVSFTETKINADGSDIQDLHHSNIYYIKDSDEIRVKATPPEQEHPDIPATNAQGGGEVVAKILVPVSKHEDVNVTIITTHTDDANNESMDSEPKAVNIDKQTPGSPQ